MERLDFETGRQMWYEALGEWEPKHQEALALRAAISNKYMAAAAGQAAWPTDAELQAVEKLEREDNLLRLKMDDISRRVFGS